MLDEGDPQSFRVRAYESAAQAIAAQATDLGTLTAKELQKIEGIGKSTAEKIRELLETGKVAKLEGLRAEAPAQRGGAAAHPGARAQGASSGCAPSWACSRSTICARAGRAQAARAEGLRRRSPRRSWRASLARLEAQGAVEPHADLGRAAAGRRASWRACCEVPGVTHASYCGSLRRFSETIGDVDIVVAAQRRRAGDGGAGGDDASSIACWCAATPRPASSPAAARRSTARGGAAPARRGAAVLHRLEGPQHQAAPARAGARADAERVRAVRDRGRQA